MSTVIVEIRPGEGGDDAVTFAGELTEVVCGHARRSGCTATVKTGRTITVTVSGKTAPSLNLERLAGTHRIQRIPRNDKRGRRHTSTATVAVLDTQAPVSVNLSWADIDTEVFSGSGPGGQHRNKTEQCARLRHRPTGTVVVATRSRSQAENIEAAFAELERRLTDEAARAAAAACNGSRRAQISSGERPVKQWTWNDQRGEVVDHESGARYAMAAFRRGRLDALTARRA